MPVTGSSAISAALHDAGGRVREKVKRALAEGGRDMLSDMQAITPQDSASSKHARDALTVEAENDGLTVRVGLTTRELTRDFFWFRFLDGGTKGGEVRYTKAGSVKRHTMTVPARPALNIRQRALDGAIDDINRKVRAAVAAGLRG